VVAPASLRDALRAAKFVTDWHTALPTQAAPARFLQQGFFARHVRRMRAVYQARQRIVDVLTDRFAGHLQVIPAAAGLHLAATAAAPAEELAAVLGRASAAGVALLPLSMYGVDRPTRPGTRACAGSAAASPTEPARRAHGGCP
jgi:GntR family transcriptional regulator/MocR family aminotransferase